MNSCNTHVYDENRGTVGGKCENKWSGWVRFGGQVMSFKSDCQLVCICSSQLILSMSGDFGLNHKWQQRGKNKQKHKGNDSESI